MPGITRTRSTVTVPDLLQKVNDHRRRKQAISASLIEKLLSRGLAVYALLFGLLSVPRAFEGQPAMNPAWAWVVGLALFGSLATLVVVGAVAAGGRPTRIAAGAVSVVFLLIVATWPWAVNDPTAVAPDAPWPSALSDTALAASAFAFRRRWAVAYLVTVYWVWVWVRQTPAGGDALARLAFGEAGYGIVLGATVLVLIEIFRRAARSVDTAHATAVTRYTRTVREHRTEVERLHVDSILHDSVMTTLLVAARAESDDDKRRAVAMAKHALTEVASTGSSPDVVDDLVPLDGLYERFVDACDELGLTAEVEVEGLTDFSIPGSVVDAFFAAVMQALSNSVQHGGPGPVDRRVRISWSRPTLTVEVVDDGIGFDVATMTPHRMGVRVSIMERLQQVGGEAAIESAPGEGTTVRLSWPRGGAAPVS